MSRAELVEFAEKEEDCFCFHCICDLPTPERPCPGILTKYFIPKTQSRDGFGGAFFTPMSPGRLEIETAGETMAFVVAVPGLGIVREEAGRLRKFLRRWEDEKCRAERKRLNYSNHFPALGKIAQIPEVEVIHSEACKLKAARERYEKALKEAFNSPNPATGDQPAPPCLESPDNDLHRDSRNLMVEQVIGRLIISKMSKNDGKFFELLADMAKNLEIEQAKTAKPETATDRKRQILFVTSKLIERASRLPSKAELLAETDSEFSKKIPLDEREFRRNLKLLGLSGLPSSA